MEWLKEWAVPLSAGATLILALMAFLAIRQTRAMQKRERKERLLNEIIEWAIEITKWRPKGIFGAIADITDKLKLQKIIWSHIAEVMENFIETRGRNKYVSDIAIEIDNNLGKAVDNLIEVLESKVELLAEWKSVVVNATAKGKEANDEQYFQKAEEQEFEIEKLALKVIEEATKIKTRDIG
ncbi:MAG: hypothetical protein KAV68_00925 [Dehalococcoidales bacterium]|nr:hypothetical protein [Dehalococcoidales bacterium]